MPKFMVLSVSDKSESDQPRYDLFMDIEAEDISEACDKFESKFSNDGSVIIVEVRAETVHVLQEVE